MIHICKPTEVIWRREMFTLLHKTTTPPFEPAFEPAIEKERHILNPRHPMKPRAGNVTCVQTNLDSSGNFKSETARDGESERRPSEKRTRGLTWSSNVVPPNRRTGLVGVNMTYKSG